VLKNYYRRILMKKLLFIALVITAIPIFFLPGTGMAEGAGEKDAVQLPDIVVTATKTEKELSKAPGSISVVTKDDIEKRNTQTIDQTLGTLSGVYNTRTRVMDIAPQISLRGMPSGLGRTLVMMDGINIVDPMLGNLYGLTGLAPEGVEKIEVVKGPFSSLYGGQAMGGVVNIIPKMPEKMELNVNTGYGSSWNRGEANDDYRRAYASYGDKLNDKLRVFLSYGIKATNGFPTIYNVQGAQPAAGIFGWSGTTDTMGNNRYLIGDKGDTTWWDDNAALRAEYEFSPTSKLGLSIYKTRFETHYDDPHTFLTNAAGNPVWSYGAVKESSFFNYNDMYREQDFYKISYETKISEISSKVSLTHVNSMFGAGIPGSASTVSGGAGKEWENPFDKSYNLEIQFSTPLFDRHLLTFGGFAGTNSGRMDEYNRTNWKDENTRTGLVYRSEGKDRTYSLFIQDEITVLDNLTAYAGLRQDRWETYDGSVFQQGFPDVSFNKREESSLSPKIALVYNPFEKTTLRTSAGKAFRAPTIVELYRTWTAPNGITYAGSSDLKPETTVSWDMGVEQKLWKGSVIKASYFENYLENLIYRGMTTPTLYENKNVGKAESKGVEFEAEQKIDNWIRLFANFTFTDSEITENLANPAIVGKNMTMLPERLFNIGADLTKGPFSASLIGRYVSKAYKNDNNSDNVDEVYGSYDSYFVADTKFSYKFSKMATLSLSIDNILDKDYFYADKTPGRSWFCEMALNF
jgi:iron complex outermembrane recepter protein